MRGGFRRATGALRRGASMLRRGPGRARPSALDELLDAFGRCRPDAVFVQVGSNDGIQFDPLRRQIASHRWGGVMIEPIPYVFEKLRQNYGDHPRITLENVAIAEEIGTRVLYYLPESDDPSLPSWHTALGSLRREVVVRHEPEIRDIERRLATVKVPCLTLEALCRKHGIDRLDLLHTDTEGYDFEILQSTDFSKLTPTMLIFEHYHMERPAYEVCTARLARFGYEHLPVGMDTVCLRTAALGPVDRPLDRLWRRLARRGGSPAFRIEVAGGTPS